jgi:hypothetical protein
MAEATVIAAVAAAGSAAAGLGVLVWTRIKDYQRAARKTRPAEEFSPGPYEPQRYEPLRRLLANEDREFVERHIRCPELAARWERSQRRIVRMYLKDLAADFHCLHRNARALVTQSPEEFADLIPLLARQQLVFWRTLVWIELRLTLGGKITPAIDPQNLVGAIDALRQELARLTPLSRVAPLA